MWGWCKFHFRSQASNYVQIRVPLKRKRRAESCLKGWLSEAVLFALDTRTYLWKCCARGQAAERGSWCQISWELLLEELLGSWHWDGAAGILSRQGLFSLAPLCVGRVDKHREVGDRRVHQHMSQLRDGVCGMVFQRQGCFSPVIFIFATFSTLEGHKWLSTGEKWEKNPRTLFTYLSCWITVELSKKLQTLKL